MIFSESSSSEKRVLCIGGFVFSGFQSRKYSISSAHSTRDALLPLIRLLHPEDHWSSGLPGTARTSRLYELAISAVISAPPFIPDSITSVASDNPAIIRFLLMKLFRSGRASDRKSVNRPPLFCMVRATEECIAGYVVLNP